MPKSFQTVYERELVSFWLCLHSCQNALLWAPVSLSAEVPDQVAHFCRGGTVQRPPSQWLDAYKSECAHLRLDRWNGRDADAQFVHSQTDQDRDGFGIGTQFAAEICPLAMFVGGVNGLGDQPQHGRMQIGRASCRERV